MNNKKIIVVAGPTASGKTSLAIELAKKHLSPVISADSRQVYKELNIGVARPIKAELEAVQHYFIAHVSILEPYNAGIYASEARTLINSLFQNHKTLIVCGGTGLYIKALLNGLDILPQRDEGFRVSLNSTLEVKGIKALQEMLKRKDIQRYNKTDIQNPLRLIRALEIAYSTQDLQNTLPDFEYQFDLEYKIMELPREELYERINKRVDEMIEFGLEKEVKKLLEYRNLKALQTVGYNEWWPYFDGLIEMKEVIEKIKQHSRNYAKRQVTWFKHQIK